MQEMANRWQCVQILRQRLWCVRDRVNSAGLGGKMDDSVGGRGDRACQGEMGE